MIVLDASIVVSWYFEKERTPAKLAVLEQITSEGGVAPAHWLTEVANAMEMAVRRGHLTPDRQLQSLEALGGLPIEREASDFEVISRVVATAARHGLTVYDAAYLEVALRQDLVLATLDEELRRAALAGGVAVLP